MMLVETDSGGHLGWTAGAEAPFGSPWPDVGAMQFIEAIRTGNAAGAGAGADAEAALAAGGVSGADAAPAQAPEASAPAR